MDKIPSGLKHGIAFAILATIIIIIGKNATRDNKKLSKSEPVVLIKNNIHVDSDGQCYKIWKYAHLTIPFGITKEICP